MSKGLKISASIFGGAVLLFVLFIFGTGIYPLGLGMHDSVQQTEGVAISGYDAVSYHLAGTPAKGSGEFSTEWNGVTWQFSSQAHLDTFKVTPEAFTPECGGYCAFAVGRGVAAGSSPDHFVIENGKLYLFSDETVKAEWLANKAEEIKAVNENWQ